MVVGDGGWWWLVVGAMGGGWWMVGGGKVIPGARKVPVVDVFALSESTAGDGRWPVWGGNMLSFRKPDFFKQNETM